MLNDRKKIRWTFFDLFMVTLLINLPMIMAIFLMLIIGRLDSRSMTHVFLYISETLLIIVPIYWIQRTYRMGLSDLGLQKGNWGISRSIVTGIICGSAIFFVISFWSHEFIRIRSEHLLTGILLPVTIGGFPLLVLGSIGQEVFFRGFLYNYMRKKFGENLGLFVQAILFSLFHVAFLILPAARALEFFFDAFLVGVLTAMLYRASNSIYSSIICHGIYNYLVFIGKYTNYGPTSMGI